MRLEFEQQGLRLVPVGERGFVLAFSKSVPTNEAAKALCDRMGGFPNAVLEAHNSTLTYDRQYVRRRLKQITGELLEHFTEADYVIA